MLSRFDLSLTQFFSQIIPHGGLLDFVFHTLSFVGATIAIWAVVLVVVLVWELHIRKNKAVFLGNITKLFVTLALTLGIAVGSVHFFIKPAVSRVRPYERLAQSAPFCPKDFSFPSGHATAAFAGAYILSQFDHNKRRRLAYVLIAVGVSYSRIYLLCHFVGDVAVGALYGLLVGSLTYFTVHFLYHKIQKSPHI